MKKLLSIIVLALIVGGFYFNNENEKKEKAKSICSEHFKTSDKICINKFWNYPYYEAKKLSKKNWPEYKKQVQEIEDKINNLDLTTTINLLDYDIVSLGNMNGSLLKNKLKNKKIVISGEQKAGFFEPKCSMQKKYSVCLTLQTYDGNTDTDIVDTFSVEISNIDKFPNIKKIIDELYSFNYTYYKLTVFGSNFKKSLMRGSIDADFIKMETVKSSDDAYEDSLRKGLYAIKRQEFVNYYKNKYPNEKNIPNLNLPIYTKD